MIEILPGLMLIISGLVIACILLLRKTIFANSIKVWRLIKQNIRDIENKRGVNSIHDLEEIDLAELDILHPNSRYYQECSSIFSRMKEKTSVPEVVIRFLTIKHTVATNIGTDFAYDEALMVFIRKVEEEN